MYWHIHALTQLFRRLTAIDREVLELAGCGLKTDLELFNIDGVLRDSDLLNEHIKEDRSPSHTIRTS